MKAWARRWGQVAGIVLAGGWAFFPAIRGGWLLDPPEITVHPALRSVAGLAKSWFAPAGSDYFPLKTTVEWAEWHLWGSHPAGSHLVTIALHVLAALLIWRLFARLRLRLAWWGGLLFAVHPLTVESVAWIAELKNTLSLPLLLLAMTGYVEFDDLRNGGARCPQRAERRLPTNQRVGDNALHHYVWSLGLFLAAMLAKSSVVMFPGVLLLYCWWRRGRIERKDVLAAAPFFTVSLILGAVTVWFQHHHVIVPLAMSSEGGGTRLALAGRAVVFYFCQGLFPVGLLPNYPRWPADPGAIEAILPYVLIVAVFAALWTKRSTWGRHALFGLGFFLLNLAPVLGLFPMAYQRISWVADHLAYLPLVGLIGLAVAAAGALTATATRGGRWAWAIGGIAVSLAFLAESHRYAAVFHDQETLWTYTLARNPDAWFAHANLAGIYLEEGRAQETIDQAELALRLNPDDALTHSNLGAALGRLGRVPEAIAEYERALSLRPNFFEAEYNLAVTLQAIGRTQEAKFHFAKAALLQEKN